MTESDPQSGDPAVHFLSLVDYEENADGRVVRRDRPLAEVAQMMSGDLALIRADEVDLENDWRTGQVAFSRGRGLVLVTLLEELAARVRPGFSCDPIQGGDELAEMAADLAATLESKRTYSADYD